MKKISKLTAILLSVGILFTGCSSTEKSKVVSIDGSTSMEKVIGYLSEVYTEENTEMKITYNPTGSGAGIQSVSEGRCDIALSSRNLKEDEVKKLKETVVCIDAVVMIVNPKNPVKNLTIEEISEIYMGIITNWNEIGGEDFPIVCIGREAASGTREGFELITNTKDRCKYTQELTSAGDIIQTVSSNSNAIGYVSLASVKDNVNMISVDGVIPAVETVQNGSYKICRDFIFVTRKDIGLSEAAQNFFDFATSEKADKWIVRAGAIPVLRYE